MTPDPDEESRTIDIETACPSEDQILDLLAGRLDAAAGPPVRAHLLACELCQDVVGELSPKGAQAPRALKRGESVGRYLVLGVRGAGAMGVVYEAYDPELTRKVALKLVRGDATDPDLRARLLREARTMAQLAHPNVIAVHDVGAVGDEVFVAMELVEGGTLTEYLRAPGRTVAEIEAAFVQAGRGLSAAHAAGLVHRDFKPDNVLVGDDGRVRVTDFGLARSAAGDTPRAADDEPLVAATLTRTGAAVGTPAYMAPEILAGGRPDARADVFAFSVALYEALAGVRPFAATTMGGLREAILRGTLEEPRRKLSPRLRAIVQKGLAASPDDRYRSMDALLSALEQRPRRNAIGAAAVVAAFVAVGGGAYALRAETCAGGDVAWGDTWGEAERARVKTAFARTSVPFAGEAVAAVDAALTARGRAWIAQHTEACESTRVRHEQSEALRDRKFACLDERRVSTRALVRLFADADAELVTRAKAAVKALPSLDDCANVAALGSAAPLPPGERTRAKAVTDALSEAKALRAAGKYALGLKKAEDAERDARTIADQRLSATALVTKGLLLEESMRFDDAEVAYHAAARLALAAHDDADAADAWVQLGGISGYRRERADEAHVWLGYAATAIAALGEDRPRLARLHDRRSLVEWSMEARLEDANADYALSLAFDRGLPSSESSRFLEEHGPIQFDMGRYDVAERIFAREVARLLREYGPDHPELLEARENQAETWQMMGRAAEAVPVYRDLLARFPDRAPGYTNHRLADALRRVGDARAALVEDELAIAAENGPDDALARAPGIHGRGLDLLLLGRASEAVTALERAAAIRAKSRLATTRAETDFALARALVAAGRQPPRALALARSASQAYRTASSRHGSRWFAEDADAIDAWLAERAR